MLSVAWFLSGPRPPVESALQFALSGPAARTGVVAVGDGTGARPTADRRVALRHQWVLEEFVITLVGGDVGVGPRGQRVHLHDPAADVEMDNLRVCARYCMFVRVCA